MADNQKFWVQGLKTNIRRRLYNYSYRNYNIMPRGGVHILKHC